MSLESFLEALTQAGVRPAFESQEEYEAFWTELEDGVRPVLEAYEKAHRESEAIAFREWRG